MLNFLLFLYMFTFPDMNFNQITEVYLFKDSKHIKVNSACVKLKIKTHCSQWIQFNLPKTKNHIVWIKLYDKSGNIYVTWVDVNVNQIHKWIGYQN